MRWCNEPLETLLAGLDSYRKGEPLQLALMSLDLSVKTFAKAIPIPIEANDGACRLSVELASPKGELFGIWGAGFVADEVVSLNAHSEGEVLDQTVRASARGAFFSLVAPAVVGKQAGTASTTASGKQCKVTVRYEWGVPAMKIQ
jgi:hypothetical protein